MKKSFVCICCILLNMFALAAFVSAHSGRTDSNGGHNCSEASIAKGLCTGYHYHNGGGSSTPSTAVPAAQSNDKDCTDFSSYDEMITYWNDKGYSATYDPENLDGWGNNVVDDGIPCEAPSNYDLTKINNSPQQKAAKQETLDRENATAAGEKNGYADGYANKEKNTATTGSSVYQQQYAASYETAYAQGLKKLEEEIQAIYDEGYAVGLKNEKLAVPETYAQNGAYKAAFERGHNAGYKAYIEQQAPAYYEQGLANGRADVYEKPTVTEALWLEQYDKGYNEAQQALQTQYKEQGYDLAYTTLTYNDEGIENEKFAAWHKEGFDDNTIASEIEPVAYEQGKSGEDLVIPEKYANAKSLYEHFYNKGYEEYVNPMPFVVGGLVALGGGGAFAYSRRGKRKEKKKVS